MWTAGATQKVRGQCDHTRWTQTVGATIPATKNWTVARLPVTIRVTRKGNGWKYAFDILEYIFTGFIHIELPVLPCCCVSLSVLWDWGSSSSILNHLNWTVKPGSWLSWMSRFMRDTKTWGGVCLYSTFTYFIVLIVYDGICAILLWISYCNHSLISWWGHTKATYRNSWKSSGLCGRVG